MVRYVSIVLAFSKKQINWQKEKVGRRVEKNIPTIVFERSLVFPFFKIRIEEMQTSRRCFSVRSFLVYNVYVVRQTE